jgi:hypothetical protein
MNRYGIFTTGQAVTFYVIAVLCVILADLDIKLALDKCKATRRKEMWGYASLAAMWIVAAVAVVALEFHLF